MEQNETWLSDSKRIISIGTALGVIIKADICKALGIQKGSLIEIKVRNTGQILEPLTRGPKKQETPEVGETPTS